MNISIVGPGLIGGSFALDLKEGGLADRVIAVDTNPEHLSRAIELGLADEGASLEDAVERSELIILAVPVDIIRTLLPKILTMIEGSNKIVADMGSTKLAIAKGVVNHPARGRYVALHPIAGTEFSGPDAALCGLFRNKNVIICDRELSDRDALERITSILSSTGMNISYMDSSSHDLHVAYVSHISHITSFSLALSVLEKEKSEESILTLAASGFESTVRLAKSNSNTWASIFLQNSEYITEVLDSYLEKMKLFKKYINEGNADALKGLIDEANEIKKILNR
ncbi:MAG TPA: prephenate dehydrogenase [Rikenellaceae bacterium]|nr:MAG: prephenate dehydrogenase [Bacteroidetes bacterium GWE2_40_15]HBZ26831.1 prephenate dehydrogenase [Rikenellaceae bacterium]